MKFQASKWPITITLELADDYTDGIEGENMKEVTSDFAKLQKVADDIADTLIKAKGMILAQ